MNYITSFPLVKVNYFLEKFIWKLDLEGSFLCLTGSSLWFLRAFCHPPWTDHHRLNDTPGRTSARREGALRPYVSKARTLPACSLVSACSPKTDLKRWRYWLRGESSRHRTSPTSRDSGINEPERRDAGLLFRWLFRLADPPFSLSEEANVR